MFNTHCGAATALLCLAVASAPAQISFNTSFPSGNGTNFTAVDATTYSFEIVPDTNSTDRQWFYFEINGAAGQTINFRLLNTNQTNVTGHWSTARPVASSDGGLTWSHVEGTTSVSSNTYFFSHEVATDSDRIAFHFPYTSAMAYAKIDEWDDHPDVSRNTLGNSIQGRPIEFLRITDAPEGDYSGRIGVWIIGRQHSAEVTASFTVEGLMDYLLSDEDDARAIRSSAVVNIVPMVNPDGVDLGNYRDNAAGINLNRVWNDTANMTTSPEVMLVQTEIDNWVAAGHPYDLFLDFHSTSGANPHFAFHLANNITVPNYIRPNDYHEDSRAYLALVNSHAPNFNATTGTTTSSDQSLAYHRQRIQYGILAFTPEGVYNRRNSGPSPTLYTDPALHREVGVGFAKAIAGYFNLDPPPTEAEGWGLF